METSRLYSLETRAMLAEMRGPYKIPTNTCGPVLTHIVRKFSDQPAPQVPSGDTVNRCIVESSRCCKFKLATTRAITRDQQLKEQRAQVDSQHLQQLQAAGYPHTTTTMANLRSWLKQLRNERKWRGSMARKHQDLLEQCLEYAQEQQQLDQPPVGMLIEDSPHHCIKRTQPNQFNSCCLDDCLPIFQSCHWQS